MKRISSQLIMFVYLPLIVASSAVVWKTFDVVESLVEHRLEKEIELVARTMRLPVEQALRDDDLKGMENTLNATFDIDRVYGAYVYDSEGQRIALAGGARPGPANRLEAVEMVRLGEERGRYLELSGEPVFSYFVPLTGVSGRIDGLLQVVRLQSEISDRLEQMRQRGLLIWSGVLLALLGIVVLGNRKVVSRPLERLVTSMARIEGGDQSHRARETGPSEIRATASALNRMLDAIGRMQQALDSERRQHTELSARMREERHLATLGRFSSGVAHELGAPLTVIDGDARRLLRLCDADEPDVTRRLKRIREQIRRTRDLIAQLMEFVRGEQHRKHRVQAARLLNRVVAGAKPEAETRDVHLEAPAVDPELALDVYPIRLEHALLNLVRNALQAARSHVRISARAADGHVEFIVEDDGPGVPEELRERIFEPFHTGRESSEGTGLGLAIVKSVAEDHGAKIRVERSEELGGSRFTLSMNPGREAA